MDQPAVAFENELEPHRRELRRFCYRMLGSVHDADDAVQETIVRAWQARDRYDAGRASIRTWLHRIATNVCITAANRRGRRALPADLGAPSRDPSGPLVPSTEVAWLEPFPDVWSPPPGDPADVVARREDVRLAVVAAMQHLPARQRAAVILREALAMSSAEIADVLATSPAAIDSALQRARATLASTTDEPAELDPGDPRRAELVAAYVDAFQRADVAAIERLVTLDVHLEMPPMPAWFAGRADYGAFMAAVYERRGRRWQAVPTGANGQEALIAYVPDDTGAPALHSLQVLTCRPDGIARNVVFYDARLLARLGLPRRPD